MSLRLSNRHLIFRLLGRRRIQSRFLPVVCTLNSDSDLRRDDSNDVVQCRCKRNYTPEAYRRPSMGRGRRIERDRLNFNEKVDLNESSEELNGALELVGLQHVLLSLTSRYYHGILDNEDEESNMLLPSIDQDEKTQPVDEMLRKHSQQLLENLNKIIALQMTAQGHSIKNVQDTEQAYQELCQSLTNFIRKLSDHVNMCIQNLENLGVVDQDDDDDEEEEMEESETERLHIAAEDLFLAFCKLHLGRVQYVGAAAEPLVQASEKSQQGWMEWLYDIFVQAPGEDEESTNEMESFAHEVPYNQPSSNLCFQVANSSAYAEGMYRIIYKDTEGKAIDVDALDIDVLYWKEQIDPQAHLQERERRQDVARRINTLFTELANTKKVNRHRFYNLLGWIIKLNGNVGLLSSATRAEKLFHKYSERNAPAFLFQSVLRVYRLASFTDPSNSEKAALRAFQLLKKRQGQINKNFRRQMQNRNTSRKKREPRPGPVAIESNKVVLQTLINTEDGVERAEELMEMLLGKVVYQKFTQEEKKDPPTLPVQTDLGLLHYMFVLYCRSPTLFDRARRLMHHMGEHRTNKVSTSDGKVEYFPNTWTYNAMLEGLLSHAEHAKKVSMEQYREKKVDIYEVRLENDVVAQEIFDFSNIFDSGMDLNFSPTLRSFERMLLLLSKMPSTQAGIRAEKLLSQMEVVLATRDPREGTTLSAYENALRCWWRATVSGYHGEISAVQCAQQIVQKMDAQSNANILTANDDKSSEFNITDGPNSGRNLWMYRADLNPLAKYNALISICARTADEARWAEALKISFETFNTMIERGIRPHVGIYASLISCCRHHLLPHDPESAKALVHHVYQLASQQGIVTERLTKSYEKTIKKMQRLENKKFRAIGQSGVVPEETITELD